MELVWLRDLVMTMHNHLAIECSSVYPHMLMALKWYIALQLLKCYHIWRFAVILFKQCICMQVSCICAQSIMMSYLYYRSQVSRTLLRSLINAENHGSLSLSLSFHLPYPHRVIDIGL